MVLSPRRYHHFDVKFRSEYIEIFLRSILKMVKNLKFEIGENRFLSAKKVKGVYEIKIHEGDGTKCAEFTTSRWASFVSILDDIQENLNTVKLGGDLRYEASIGGGWYASVSTGFRCVDLRKFYVPWGQIAPKPTKTGIALRLSEWDKLKEVIPLLHEASPEIAKAYPCSASEDHANQIGFLNCSECTPFGPHNY